MRLIEGFYIDHDVTISEELQGGFMVQGIMGTDAIVDILPADELGIKL